MDPHVHKLNKKLQYSSNNVQNLLQSILPSEQPLAKPDHHSQISLPSVRKQHLHNPQQSSAKKKSSRCLPLQTQLAYDTPQSYEKTKNKFYSNNKQKSKRQKLSNEKRISENSFSSIPKKNFSSKELDYIKKKQPLQTKPLSIGCIEDLNPEDVLQYVKNSQKLTKQTSPEFIFDYFFNLASYLKRPLIKKYKNCLFYGQNPNSPNYQGFLYFYDTKIYYGNFTDEHKQGKGVQINLQSSTIFKGKFNRGHKEGIFEVRKPDQLYEGYLQKGKYHGTGKLTTPFTMYQGQFRQGYRHGYGEQLILKTGLKLCGTFKMNKFYNNKQKEDKQKSQKKESDRKKGRSPQKRQKFKFSSTYDYEFDGESDADGDKKGKEMIRRIVSKQFQSQKLLESASEDDNLPSPFKKYIRNK